MRGARLIGLVVVVFGLPPAPAQAAFPGSNGKFALTGLPSSCSSNCTFHLFTADSDGAALTDLGVGARGVWSADGKKLAFTDAPGLFSDGRRIYTANADGSGRTLVLDWGLRVGGLSWSPDGSMLAAALENCSEDECRTDIYSMRSDGTGLTDLTPDLIEDRDPAWSPDGSKIAFGSSRNGNLEVVTINADGNGATNLTNNPATDEDPSWSPDGTQLAFSRETSVLNQGVNDIWIMNADGSGQTQVTPRGQNDLANRIQPAWSPDGAMIVYAGPFVIDLRTGTTSSPFGTTNHPSYYPDWQPVPAQTGYPRPRGASPIRVPLVPAYNACSTPNRTHGAPLLFGSCAPPTQTSTEATVGTPDANGEPAQSIGLLRLIAVPGDPSTTANEADVRIPLDLTDIRRPSDLGDYLGGLSLRLTLRITDKDSGSAGVEAATVEDVPLSFDATGCQADPADSIGTECWIDTTIDAVLPGAIKEGARQILEVGQVKVFDGGPDGDPSTDPNTLFAVQGVFAP